MGDITCAENPSQGIDFIKMNIEILHSTSLYDWCWNAGCKNHWYIHQFQDASGLLTSGSSQLLSLDR